MDADEFHGKTVVCEGRIGSTTDARVVNNVVRHEYPVLTEREKQQMRSIKDIGRELIEYLDHVGGTSHHSRELSLAKTKVEEAVMWAVKHVTA